MSDYSQPCKKLSLALRKKGARGAEMLVSYSALLSEFFGLHLPAIAATLVSVECYRGEVNFDFIMNHLSEWSNEILPKLPQPMELLQNRKNNAFWDNLSEEMTSIWKEDFAEYLIYRSNIVRADFAGCSKCRVETVDKDPCVMRLVNAESFAMHVWRYVVGSGEAFDPDFDSCYWHGLLVNSFDNGFVESTLEEYEQAVKHTTDPSAVVWIGRHHTRYFCGNHGIWVTPFDKKTWERVDPKVYNFRSDDLGIGDSLIRRLGLQHYSIPGKELHEKSLVLMKIPVYNNDRSPLESPNILHWRLEHFYIWPEHFSTPSHNRWGRALDLHELKPDGEEALIDQQRFDSSIQIRLVGGWEGGACHHLNRTGEQLKFMNSLNSHWDKLNSSSISTHRMSDAK